MENEIDNEPMSERYRRWRNDRTTERQNDRMTDKAELKGLPMSELFHQG